MVVDTKYKNFCKAYLTWKKNSEEIKELVKNIADVYKKHNIRGTYDEISFGLYVNSRPG